MCPCTSTALSALLRPAKLIHHETVSTHVIAYQTVLLQYMSFPLQSPEKVSLVPVIATLLQFNAKELEQVRVTVGIYVTLFSFSSLVFHEALDEVSIALQHQNEGVWRGRAVD